MANDCSERICQFGLAHVDSPKGDLDASSGALFAPNNLHTRVVSGDQIYPYGTVEKYPDVVDTEGNIITNSAHEYRECSNKGICDRSAGTCTCFDGYDGSACQRASCPSNSNGVCSGHGMCLTVKAIADQYNSGNIYRLWDKDSTMGCVCDAGYFGPDCSERKCKYGFDPLYIDTSSTTQTYRFSNWTFALYSMQAAADVTTTKWQGNYSIVFYDSSGEDWVTTPIGINSQCDAIVNALESLPNNVVPSGSVRCSFDNIGFGNPAYIWDGNSYGLGNTGYDGFPAYLDSSQKPSVAVKFTLAFPGNPGWLKQPQINYFLDGSRPTLVTGETSTTGVSGSGSSLGSWVFPNGYIGEDVDYFSTICPGITVTLNDPVNGNYGTLGGLDVQGVKALKRCLGDSNGNPKDNSEVYNWDYGNADTPSCGGIGSSGTGCSGSTIAAGTLGNLLSNPHIIKLIDTTAWPATRLCHYHNGIPTGSSQNNPASSIMGFGYCDALNPPGFYAIVYYDDTTKSFFVINRLWEDFSQSTTFNVFTTTGYLTLVSQNALAYTTSTGLDNTQEARQLFSNTLFTTNSSVSTDSIYNGFTSGTAVESYAGAIDCETINAAASGVGSLAGNPSSSPLGNGAFTCLNKGDKVVVLNARAGPGHQQSNPKYINIYTVDKISRENRQFWSHPDSEKWRHQIKFTTSMNARYQLGSIGVTPVDYAAAVYKFTPPIDGSAYQYAGECSKRGICDRSTGACSCFPGYTSDSCAVLNALAQ
jgi:hypothetical protein